MNQFPAGAGKNFIGLRKEIQTHGTAMTHPQCQCRPARQIESRRENLPSNPGQQFVHAWVNSFPVRGF
jgi:hypothetical protein